MVGRSPIRRVVAVAAASLAVSSFSFFAPSANAAAPGPYSGYAHASAVHVDAITNGATRIANVDAGVTNAAVNSAGLSQVETAHNRNVIPDAAIGKKSVGHSQLVEVGLAGAPNAEGQIQGPPLPGPTAAFAPGEQAKAESLIPRTTQAPLINALAVHRTATPVWNGSTCVLGEPISEGTFEAARVEVLDQNDNTATPNFDTETVGIAANADGPDRDAVNEVSLTQLYDGTGAGFGLMAATMSTIAPVTLFEGTANELTVEVLGPAVLRAMADGTPGGAKVEFSAPAVSIIQNGVRNVILPNDQLKLIQLPAEDGGVLEIRIGQLDVNDKASNGTSARAIGSVVTVELLDGAADALKVATVAIGQVEAAVSVPAGGIQCELRVEVDADPPQVPAGKTVEVTTTVHNDYNCPLQAVTLVDSITAQQDATFTITDAPGSIRKTGGTGLTRGEVEWLIPSIPAKGSATRSFALRMDSGAGKVFIEGVADGKLANCAVSPGKDDATVAGLGSANANVGGSSGVTVPVSRVLGGGVKPGGNLPTTGVGSFALAGIAMLTTAGGLMTALRRRAL